jgi:hypothetical protein
MDKNNGYVVEVAFDSAKEAEWFIAHLDAIEDNKFRGAYHSIVTPYVEPGFWAAVRRWFASFAGVIL